MAGFHYFGFNRGLPQIQFLKIRARTHDGIGVAEFDSTLLDRRRSPRFNCGGRAKIYCLPFDGNAIFSGTLRNLSSGGICLAMGPPFEPGSLMEVVVQVSTASFRAAAVVRGQRDPSATSLEFVQISAGAKDVLEDVLVRLARLQALNRRLRSQRMDAETERVLAESQRSRVWAGAGRSANAEVHRETKSSNLPIEREIAEILPELLEIDLFG